MKIPKLKKKAFKIDLEIYPYTIFVCFLDFDLLIEFLKKEKHPPTEENLKDIISNFENINYAAKVLPLKNGNVIMYIPNNYLEQNFMVNSITHESLHITHMIMDRIGLKLNFKSDEAFCYLNGFINEKIFEQI